MDALDFGIAEPRTLDQLRADGYCTEEWHRWQQGYCGTYAVALAHLDPSLRLGVIGRTQNGDGDASEGWTPSHWVAHDDAYAYDSAGRHPLPYLGLHLGRNDYAEWDAVWDDWCLEDEEGTDDDDILAAQAHARRNGILTGEHVAQGMPT
jgi:hypothetical protein